MHTLIGVRVPKTTANDIQYLAKEEQLDKSAVVRRLLGVAVSNELVNLAIKKYSDHDVSLGRAAEKKIPVNYSLSRNDS